MEKKVTPPVSNRSGIEKETMMMMKKMIAFALILFVISSLNMDGVECQIDCYDSCSTGCVAYFGDPRRMQRCDRKCQIQCAPGNSFTFSLP
ncbi:hypothetical protein F0562_020336 [Nyssa sinensis]|uniref:Uncharacterized protein n=1 Tax=Nyssa sinensis TaxID=561372 RepID=A0A5J5BVE6_9ASTE|nr:hypothetical protein F0562_020336 [Nyssa sinensis]